MHYGTAMTKTLRMWLVVLAAIGSVFAMAAPAGATTQHRDTWYGTTCFSEVYGGFHVRSTALVDDEWGRGHVGAIAVYTDNIVTPVFRATPHVTIALRNSRGKILRVWHDRGHGDQIYELTNVNLRPGDHFAYFVHWVVIGWPDSFCKFNVYPPTS